MHISNGRHTLEEEAQDFKAPTYPAPAPNNKFYHKKFLGTTCNGALGTSLSCFPLRGALAPDFSSTSASQICIHGLWCFLFYLPPTETLEIHILTHTDTYTTFFLLTDRLPVCYGQHAHTSVHVLGTYLLCWTLSWMYVCRARGRKKGQWWIKWPLPQIIIAGGWQTVVSAECITRGADVMVGARRRSEMWVEVGRTGRDPAGLPGEAEEENVPWSETA